MRATTLNLALDGGGVGAFIGPQAFPHVAVIHNGALVAGLSSRAGGWVFPVAVALAGAVGMGKGGEVRLSCARWVGRAVSGEGVPVPARRLLLSEYLLPVSGRRLPLS